MQNKTLQNIKNNRYFELFIVITILISSLNIGISTYHVEQDIKNLIDILDVIITVLFLLELFIRILAEEKWTNFFKSGWNIFDFVVITLSIIPLESSSNILIIRLLRIFRILRLISFIPELRSLVNSLFSSLKKISYISLLMFIIFYLYAIFGSIIFHDINPELWGTVDKALLTLFTIGTLENWTQVMYETMKVYPLSWLYYVSFIFLIAFIFLNMMIAVLLNKMDQEHEESQDNEIQKINQKVDIIIDELNKNKK